MVRRSCLKNRKPLTTGGEQVYDAHMFEPPGSQASSGSQSPSEERAEGWARAEATAARLEGELAEACGTLNAATAKVVGLIGEVLAAGSWQGAGVRSPEHWVGWQGGVPPGRARALVMMARRLRDDLPAARAAFEGGEVAEDQVRVLCRHVPAHNHQEATELARYASVSHLNYTVGRYPFEAGPAPEPEPWREPDPEPHREAGKMSFGWTDAGTLSGHFELPADEGALVERALTGEQRTLLADAEDDQARKRIGWADALVSLADRAMASSAAERPGRDRYTALVHLEADEPDHPARIHLGPRLDDAMRRYLLCDANIRTVLTRQGIDVNVGRVWRTAPEQTRVAVEHRDCGCRVPGCGATKRLHIHHLLHWEDGGESNTANLIALCPHHHRLHHRGLLRIGFGDADDPDGVTFTTPGGEPITPRARPGPPGPPPPGNYTHPTGERLDPWCIGFRPLLARVANRN